MLNTKLKIFFLFLLIANFVPAQNKTNDSLKSTLKNLPPVLKDPLKDTLRCYILSAMIEAENIDAVWIKYNEEMISAAEMNLNNKALSSSLKKIFYKFLAVGLNNKGVFQINSGNPAGALETFARSLKVFEETGNTNSAAAILNETGKLHHRNGDFFKALECFDSSLKLYKKNNNESGFAEVLQNKSFVFYSQGLIARALELSMDALKIQEKIRNKEGVALTLAGLGVIYRNQGDNARALDCYNKSLEINKELGNKIGISTTLNNMGLIYREMGDVQNAIIFFEKSLAIESELENKMGIGTALNNLGFAYYKQGDFSKALKYQEKSLEIHESINDKKGMIISLNNIGSSFFKMNKYNLALKSCLKSLVLSRELRYPENIRNAAEALSKIYKLTGDNKKALENYELYIQMRDSLNNESTRKASIKSQLKYEYEKQAAADSVAHAKESEIKNVQLQKQTAEIKAKKNQQYALFGGLGLVIIFAGFMFNRFKVTQKQKTIIEEQKTVVEEQKHLVEEKQKEVMDSIRYAQRIQRAQLPSEKKIIKSLERLMK